MKKLLIFILILISVEMFSQTIPGYNTRVVREKVIAFAIDSGLHIPRYNGTPSGVRSGVYVADGAIALDTTNHRFYIYSGGAWVRLASYSEISGASNFSNTDLTLTADRTHNASYFDVELNSLKSWATIAGTSPRYTTFEHDSTYIKVYGRKDGNISEMLIRGDSILFQPANGVFNIDSLQTTSDTTDYKPIAWNPVTGSFRKFDYWSGGGGSGAVNTGAANKAAYYPSGGTTVDDWAGVEFANTNLNTKIITQATTEVGAEIKLQSSQTANALNISSSSGTGDLANFQANGSASINGNNFKVDAVNGRVGIGENGTPQTTLQIGEDAGASTAFGSTAQLFVTNNGSSAIITTLGATSSETFIGSFGSSGILGTINSIPLEIRTANTTRLNISSAGAMKFNAYGSGTFTGTPARYAAWESDGDMIEVTASSLKPALNKAVTIESPSSSEAIDMWQTPVAITITSLKAILRGSTPSVTYNIRFGTDIASSTDVFTADITCTSVTTGCSNSSGFNDATIPAGSFIWVITSAQSGTVNSISLTINYTED